MNLGQQKNTVFGLAEKILFVALFVVFLYAQIAAGRFPSLDEQPASYSTLTHYWRFDHHADFTDSITRVNASFHGNRNDISIRGSLQDNGHVNINDSSYLQLNGIHTPCFHSPNECRSGVTLAFWLRSNSIRPQSFIKSSTQYFHVFRNENSNITIRIVNDSKPYEAEFPLKPRSWSHVTIDWSTHAGMHVYRNGWVEQTHKGGPRVIASGLKGEKGLSLSLLGNASYDDVMIWEKTLDEYEIKKLFQSQLNVMTNITCEKTVTSLNVSWQHSRDVYNMIQSFTLKLRQEGGSRTLITKSLPKSASYFELKNLLPFTRYRIKVWVKTEKDGYRKTRVVRCRTNEGVPERVEHLKAIPKTPTALSMRWAPPIRINGILKGYVVNVTSASYNRLLMVRGKQTLHLTRLRQNTTYHIGVAARTAGGLGPVVFVSATTMAVPILTKGPKKLQAIARSWKSIRVTWSPLSKVTEVFLYEAAVCTENDLCLSIFTNKTSYTIRGLAQLTEYHIRVRAKNMHGFSPWAAYERGVLTPDRDECQERVANCSQFASCSNTRGAYLCSCLPGFVGSGIFCTPIPLDKAGLCPHEVARNLSWPATYTGERAHQHCPPGTSGMATRLCGSKGGKASWEHPELDDCVSVRFAQLQSRLSKAVLDTSAAADIAGALAEVTSSSRDRQMYGGDVKLAVSMMGTLGMKTILDPSNATEEDKRKMANVTSNLVQVASNLLDSGTLNAWEEVPEESRTAQATMLLNSLEEISLVTAATLTSEEPVVKETSNVLLNMQMFKRDNMAGETTYPSSDSPVAARISIPLEEINPGQNLQGNSTQVSYLYYNNIGKLLSTSDSDEGENEEEQPQTGDGVLSFSVRPRPRQIFSKPVEITLVNPEYRENMVPVCVFWNDTSSPGLWSHEGCFVNTTNLTHTVCHCYHLTSFAVLMQFSPDTFFIAAYHKFALSLISYIGIGISLVALVIAFVTFTTFTFLRSSRNFTHINLTLSLILAEVLFLVGIDKTQYPLPCSIIAIALHYLFLVVFCWMASEGITLYFMLVRVFPSGTSGPRKKLFFIASWGLPAVIVGFGAVFYFKGYGNSRYCWLSVEDGYIWSFLGPLLVISLVNLVFLSMTFKTMADRSNRQAVEKNKNFSHFLPPLAVRYWAKACAVLTCLLGTTWLLGLFFVNKESVVMAYLFNIFNALQGLFIFIFHCVADERIRAEYARIICCRGNRRDYARKKSTGTGTFTLSKGKLGSASNGTLKDKKTVIGSSDAKYGTLSSSRKSSKPPYDDQDSSQSLRDAQTGIDSDSLLTINKTSEGQDDIRIVVYEPRNSKDLSEPASDTEYDNLNGRNGSGKHDELQVGESLFNVSSLEDYSSSKEQYSNSEDQSGLSMTRSKDYYSDSDCQYRACALQYDTADDAEDLSENGEGSHPTLITDTGMLLTKLGRCKICSNSAYHMVCVHDDPEFDENTYGSYESGQVKDLSFLDTSTEEATTSSDLSHEHMPPFPRGRVSFDDRLLSLYTRDDPLMPRVKKHRWTHTPMTGDSLSLDIPEYLTESASCDDRFLRSQEKDKRNDNVADKNVPDSLGERLYEIPLDPELEPELEPPELEVEPSKGYEPLSCILSEEEPTVEESPTFEPQPVHSEPVSTEKLFSQPDDPPDWISEDAEPESKPTSPVAPIALAESIVLIADVEPARKFEFCETESLNEDYQVVYVHLVDQDVKIEELGDEKFKSSLEVKILTQSPNDQTVEEDSLDDDSALLLEEETAGLEYDDLIPCENLQSPTSSIASPNSPVNITIEPPAPMLRGIPDIIPEGFPKLSAESRRALYIGVQFPDAKRSSKTDRKRAKEQKRKEQYERTKIQFPDARVVMLGGDSESSLDSISDRGSVVSDSGSLYGERESLIYTSLEPTQEVDWSEGATTDEDTAREAAPKPEPPKVRRGLVKRLGRIFESKGKLRTRNIGYNIEDSDEDGSTASPQIGTVKSLRERFERSGSQDDN